MEPIKLRHNENPDYKDQLTYLIKREFHVTYFAVRKYPYYLTGITIPALAIIIFSPTDSLITFKAIAINMLALTWAISIILSLPIILKWIKRNRWKNKMISISLNDNKAHEFYFDQEILVFKEGSSKSEIPWSDYTYWTEHKNSIFLFPKLDLYYAICFSVRDLGLENYQEFKRIASTKLTRLSD